MTTEKRRTGPTCAAPGCGQPLYPGNLSGVCRDHVHLKGICQCKDCHGVAYRRAARQRPNCAVPGCGNALSVKNASGVCPTHLHSAGFCACALCVDLSAPGRSTSEARDGVRTVNVARYSAVNSGEAQMTRVSLPCEPWLRGDA